MEANNKKNIFLYKYSNYYQNYYLNNIDENEIYKNIELKMDKNNRDNKEEKYMNYFNSRNKRIFNKIYGKKISLFTQSNLDIELTIEQYIEELKKKYHENPMHPEDIKELNNRYYYRFSLCFFCHCPAFAYNDEVSCINKCFNVIVRTNAFNENHTLDNFLKSHFEFCSKHTKCNGHFIPILINEKIKEPYFICTNCDNELLENYFGIKL